MKPLVFTVVTFLAAGNSLPRFQEPRLPEKDRIRIAEVFRIADVFKSKIWQNWEKTPFALLLVTPSGEFLIRHPHPSDDFTPLGYDSLLQGEVYYRPTTFQTDLLATFPAVGGIATIVVGQAENTQARRSTRWVLTVLHEHFHQLQQSQPDYYQSVNALDLRGNDQSGMWMLNYPFPYDSVRIAVEFQLLAKRLRETLLAPKPEFTVYLNRYLLLRDEFKQMLKPADYRYFSFQLWQEGAARYTEAKAVELIAEEYSPTPAFRNLDDYRPFEEEFRGIRFDILAQLRTMKLRETRRSAFYPFGAAEALLLDRASPGWRQEYFSRRFFLETLFPSR